MVERPPDTEPKCLGRYRKLSPGSVHTQTRTPETLRQNNKKDWWFGCSMVPDLCLIRTCSRAWAKMARSQFKWLRGVLSIVPWVWVHQVRLQIPLGCLPERLSQPQGF